MIPVDIFAAHLWRLIRRIGLICIVLVGLSGHVYAAISISVTITAAAPTIAAGGNASFTDAGDTITFTYVVTNSGDVTVTNVAPADAGPKFNGIAGTNSLSVFTPASVATLAPGASQSFIATYTLSVFDVNNAVGIVNGVTSTASATAMHTVNTITAANSTTSTTITAFSGLSIAKTYALTDVGGGTAGKADLGETVTYTYVISNNGNVPMTTVWVKDMHGTPAVLVPQGVGGITMETLTTPGPLGAGASTNSVANDGIWDRLASGAAASFTWVHIVTQAEIDHG